jgi:hypothetical protein
MLEVLRRHQVRFVVIGGCASQLHGWAGQTEDLDITPQRHDSNLERLVLALRELRARIVDAELPPGFELPGGIDVRLLRRMTSASFETALGRLDVVLTPDGTRGFDGLSRSAFRVRVGPSFVLYSSLEDVIASKRAAGRAKDHAMLPLLEQLRRHHGKGG